MKKLFCVICSKYERLEKPNTSYLLEKTLVLSITAWKVSKYGVFSGPYFTAFGLNTERDGVFLRIQFEYGKIRTRKKNRIWTLFTQCVIYKIKPKENMKQEFRLKKIVELRNCLNEEMNRNE